MVAGKKASTLNGVDVKVSATMPSDTVITADTNGVVVVDAAFTPDVANVTEVLSKRTGLKFGYAEYYQKGKKNAAYNGHYDPTTKTIYFRKGASEEEIIYKTAVHDLTHFAESSKHYSYVSDFVLNKKFEGGMEGEAYKNAVNEKISAYAKNGIELTPEEARRELVAENVRAAIFATEADVDKLVKTDYTFAQRILDIIDNFIYHFNNTFGRLKGDAKILADLEQARRKYRLALASAKRMRGGDVGVKSNFWITKNDALAAQALGRKSINKLDSEEMAKLTSFARMYFSEISVKSPFFRAWFGDWRQNDEDTIINVVELQKESRIKEKNGATVNADTGFEINVSNVGKDHIKIHFHDSLFSKYIIENLEDITREAILLDTYTSERTSNTKHKNTAMMHSFYAVVDFNGRKSVVKLYVEEFFNDWNSKVQRRDYDLKEIEVFDDADGFGKKDFTPPYASKNTSINNVSDLFHFVKAHDVDFNPKQTSVICNEDGTPMVMYHGTSSKFDVFDISKGRANMDIQGAFFSPWELDARGYGENVGAYYLSIKDPADGPTAFAALNKFKGQDNAGVKAREYLIQQGYDGVNFYDEEYIAFYPEQIKSATDNIGLFDKNKPNVKFSFSSPKTDTEESIFDADVPMRHIDGSVRTYAEYRAEQDAAQATEAESAHQNEEQDFAPAPGVEKSPTDNADVAAIVNADGNKRTDDIELQYSQRLKGKDSMLFKDISRVLDYVCDKMPGVRDFWRNRIEKTYITFLKHVFTK